LLALKVTEYSSLILATVGWHIDTERRLQQSFCVVKGETESIVMHKA